VQQNSAASVAEAKDLPPVHSAMELFAEAKTAHKMSGEIALKEIFMT
jgi:hypothetical protein